MMTVAAQKLILKRASASRTVANLYVRWDFKRPPAVGRQDCRGCTLALIHRSYAGVLTKIGRALVGEHERIVGKLNGRQLLALEDAIDVASCAPVGVD
jgi:hypothetical protein